MTEAFVLDPRLQADGDIAIDLSLCQVILVNNIEFPWVILVPKIPNLTEITDLNEQDSMLLMQEIRLISKVFLELFKPAKLNIAALGNKVAQLHIHIIARFKDDQAWPQPAFGLARKNYPKDEYSLMIEQIRSALCKK